jgi:HAMP domain-containing protein
MYTIKKKRAVDPNAPPRPTLLGHDKEMRGFKTRFDTIEQDSSSSREEIARLKRKVNRLEQQLEAVTNLLRRR